MLRCLTCDNTSIKFDPFMYLSLPIVKRKNQQVISLRSCIREFCKAEVLTGDSQWNCNKCKKKKDAQKRLSLWKLPSVLIIHLKRLFNYFTCQYSNLISNVIIWSCLSLPYFTYLFLYFSLCADFWLLFKICFDILHPLFFLSFSLLFLDFSMIWMETDQRLKTLWNFLLVMLTYLA